MKNLENDGIPAFWDVLKSVDMSTILDDLPPSGLGPMERAAWRLVKTISDPIKGSDAACVSAAKEILDRLYGKVPVVERRESSVSLADLDTTGLDKDELVTFQMLLQKMIRGKKNSMSAAENGSPKMTRGSSRHSAGSSAGSPDVDE